MSSNTGCPSHMSNCRFLVGFDIRSGRHVVGGDLLRFLQLLTQPLQQASQRDGLWVCGRKRKYDALLHRLPLRVCEG